MKKINSCMEIFFRCLVAKSHQRYIAEQCTAVGKHLARYTTIQNFPDTWAMLSTCSCKHLRCKFDVIISRMIWVIHRRCSRTTLRSIGDAMAMFSPVYSIFSTMQQYANRTQVISSVSMISFGSHKVCGST